MLPRNFFYNLLNVAFKEDTTAVTAKTEHLVLCTANVCPNAYVRLPTRVIIVKVRAVI